MGTETSAVDLSKPLEEMTREELLLWGYKNALEKCDGNRTHAANRFEVSVVNMQRYAKIIATKNVCSRNNSDCKPSE